MFDNYFRNKLKYITPVNIKGQLKPQYSPVSSLINIPQVSP